MQRDPAALSATAATALLVSAAAALCFIGPVRFFGGFPPPHSGLYLVPIGAIIYAVPALIASFALGTRTRLATGLAPGLLTFVGVVALVAAAVAVATSTSLSYGAYTALLYSPAIVLVVVSGEIIRRSAARNESAGFVLIFAGIAWAAAWLLSMS